MGVVKAKPMRKPPPKKRRGSVAEVDRARVALDAAVDALEDPTASLQYDREGVISLCLREHPERFEAVMLAAMGAPLQKMNDPTRRRVARGIVVTELGSAVDPLQRLMNVCALLVYVDPIFERFRPTTEDADAIFHPGGHPWGPDMVTAHVLLRAGACGVKRERGSTLDQARRAWAKIIRNEWDRAETKGRAPSKH